MGLTGYTTGVYVVCMNQWRVRRRGCYPHASNWDPMVIALIPRYQGRWYSDLREPLLGIRR